MTLRHTVLAAIALVGSAWTFAHQAAPAPAARTAPAKAPKKALDKPLWRDLSQAQQVALQPLADEWDQMDGVRKKKWLEMANKFASMKPEEQQRVHERMRDWVRLTPDQRKLARDTYTRTKKLEPGQKTATWESYQQLPEEQKKKLAAARKQGGTPRAAAAKPPAAAAKPPVAAACPAGTVKNTASATPPCVAAPAATPVQPPAAPPVAAPPPSTTPPASNAQ